MTISVHVALASGRSVTLQAGEGMQVQELKEMVEQHFEVSVDSLVTSQGARLSRFCCLRRAGVQDGDTLTATVRTARLVKGSAALAVIRGDGSVVTWGESCDGGNSSRVRDQLTDVRHVVGNSSAFAAKRERSWGLFFRARAAARRPKDRGRQQCLRGHPM